MGIISALAGGLLGTKTDLPSPILEQWPELSELGFRRGGLPLRVGGWFLGQSTVAAITLGRTIFLARGTRFNPELFRALYFDLLERPTDRAALRAALDRVTAYLDERTPALFRPVLAYLAEAGGPRSLTEINAHFSTRCTSVPGANFLDCFWRLKTTVTSILRQR